MVFIDNENLLFKVFDAALQSLILPYDSFIDVGCGTGNHTRHLRLKSKFYVDAQEIKDPPKPFMKMDVTDVFFAGFDVIMGLDFIEHLTKEGGYKFLIRGLQTAKLIILFSPEGEYHVKDATGPDQHQSSWTAQEMNELGFDVWLCPNFHPTLGIGAFMCWKFMDGKEVIPEVLYKALKEL